ncbi:Protein of unknown function [Filimonas lacunae]|uniref:DUF3347 domain-containing protein n=1 Tax=Filimonas lacunae TaxID=477680 RepID=A0A173MAD8_9BACT|nr:DUF3347 domain-containing protein [Filimonas lacunae]BAV04480.1 Co/Zn/Cd efflux system membrane fusion protein [Filimonas lacunae]SIT31542.1 Protein of unknown function [Filimonas lacunae]
MKAILLFIGISLCTYTSFAQVKHAATATVKVYGNCNQCKTAIEKAANSKHSQAVWNSDNQTAVITYDSTRTTLNTVLKQIALAGYDNEQFLAPQNVYAQLPACCQYTRVAKKASLPETEEHSAHTTTSSATIPAHALGAVADAYFAMKNALVAGNSSQAAVEANRLQQAIEQVAMAQLAQEQHMAWMKAGKDLAASAAVIASVKDIDKQRMALAQLSTHLYPVIKAGGIGRPVYYQHCPMYNDGADWFSTEKAIKNPYYGNQMLTCGKTTETIQ